MRRWLHNVLVAYDILWNMVFGGREGETISSRVGRGAIKGSRLALILEAVIDFFFGAGHCRANIQSQYD